MNQHRWMLAALVVVSVSYRPGSCVGQVFLQSLPEEGSQITFQGVYRVTRPDPAAEGESITTEWLRQITISSVGSAIVELPSQDGETTQQRRCRWIEFKMEQGKQGPRGFALSPAGGAIYKCLIPEDAIAGATSDFLPIVRGYRQLANQEPQPIQGQVLRIMPIVTLWDHYPDLRQQAGETVDLQGLGQVACTVKSGTRTLQGKTGRCEAQGQIWSSDRLPFGIARWRAAVRREELLGSVEGAQYRFAAEVTTEMAYSGAGQNARSALPEYN